MTAPELRVFDCPQCGAPLPPAADGQHVTCKFCQHATVIEQGGAAMLREQESRKEAEQLFARLGQPPNWTQSFASVLVNPWAWLFGFPLLFWLLTTVARAPQRWLDAFWEARHHERLLHVLSPVPAWLLSIGWLAAIIIGMLIWSLYGERIDSRRGLQAALACKPPRTVGGHARCRNCDGDLDVPDGTLGARCPFCGADNLMQVPARWAKRAARIRAGLRLNMETARSRDAESRRRVRRAALWRVPLVCAMLAVVVLPLRNARHLTAFRDLRYDAEHRIGVDVVAIHHAGDTPSTVLHTFAACADEQARERILRDSLLATESSDFCRDGPCILAAIIALSRGDKLRLVWNRPGPATLRVALAPREYSQVHGGILWDGFGDAVLATELLPGAAGTTAAEVPIETSGYYKIDLRGARGIVVEPCVVLR